VLSLSPAKEHHACSKKQQLRTLLYYIHSVEIIVVPESGRRGSFWDVFLSKNRTMEKVKEIYHRNKELMHTDYNLFFKEQW